VPEEPEPRFLVAEPDKTVAELLCEVLDEGFPGCDVTVAQRGDEVWRVIRTDHRDLAIIEAHLPGATGEWVLRQIRGTARRLPVIMTAAYATEALEAKLLRLEADDFLRKPFGAEVLLERVRACLRRTPPERRTHTRVGDLTICHRRYSLRVNGSIVPLTHKEHGVLAALAGEPGRVVPKAELMKRVWGRDDPDFRVVYFVVNALREKLKPCGAGDLIHTQRGVGYALIDGKAGT